MSESVSTPVLNLEQVKFFYRQKKRKTPAASWSLEIPKFEVQRGQHVFLRGASGSGKSTLLNIIAGIHKANTGRVEVLGNDLGQMSAGKRDKLRSAHIGFVFQQLNLIPYLSVLDNILLAQHFTQGNKNPKLALPLIKHILAELHLEPNVLEQAANTLSIGQQQRVAIARALVNRPELLIADEPTSALDSDNRDAFMQLLFRLANENNTSLLFVSHDPSLSSGFERIIEMTELNVAGANPEHVIC